MLAARPSPPRPPHPRNADLPTSYVTTPSQAPALPYRTGPELILATKPFAKDETARSWWCVLSTGLLLLAALAGTLWELHLATRITCSFLAGLLLMRSFVIYHDQQHRAILPRSVVAEGLMRAFGIFVLSPSSVWRSSHDHHHTHNSKLRGSHIGSYPIMTKEQFLKSSKAERRAYLFVRHPLTISFGYVFMFLYGMCVNPFRNYPRKHFECLIALLVPPTLTTDAFRYVWDGRVQAAGINPYRYIPSAPELSHLRDAMIYPKINRADYAPTIYPPTAQMFFLLVTRLGESVLVMKLALLACEGVTIAATLAILARLDLPRSRIAALVWHPLQVWEIAGSGHIDALMCALFMAAVIVYLGGRTLAAGVLATMAALVKPTALLALPVFWRPWRIWLPLLFLATIALLYAPYLAVGWKVLGFLPAYVAEEGLDKGYGFRLVMIVYQIFGVVPYIDKIYAAVFGIVMVALALLAGFRRDRSPAATIAALAVIVCVFLVLLTPHFPWYYLAAVPFLAVYPWSWTLWVITVAGVLTYNEIPSDILPAYIHLMMVFNAMVCVAVVRDVCHIRANPHVLPEGALAP